MINLNGTNTDLLKVVTGSAKTIDVDASWVDYTSPTTFAPDSLGTAITTATTTTVVGSPSSGVIRNIKNLTIRNKDTTSCVITVQRYDGSASVTVDHFK